MKHVSSAYRPFLDGVRALAIVLVIIEHSNLVKGLPFGYFGVGLFFCLSGYLITGNSLPDLYASGRISVLGFYWRRFVRLMPALMVVVLVCSTVFVLQHQYRAAFNGVFALTYLMNYASFLNGAHLGGYGHAWSLAVEQHFYLVYPLFLNWVYQQGGRKGLVLGFVSVVLLVLGWKALLHHGLGYDGLLFYLGSFERMDSILPGCLACLLMTQVRIQAIWAYVSVLALLALFFVFDSVPLELKSISVALLSCVLYRSMDDSPSGLRALLSLPWVAYVGKISYSWYLWHIPLYAILGKAFESSPMLRVAEVVLGFGLAVLSFEFIEKPGKKLLQRKAQAWQLKVN